MGHIVIERGKAALRKMIVLDDLDESRLDLAWLTLYRLLLVRKLLHGVRVGLQPVVSLQPCAQVLLLPIDLGLVASKIKCVFLLLRRVVDQVRNCSDHLVEGIDEFGAGRSEERRVGKECRSRWS